MPKVERKWGWYKDLWRGKRFCLKLLAFAPMHELSIQRHARRAEIWIGLSKFLWRWIGVGQWHSMVNPTQTWAYILEFQFGRPDENDIERRTQGGKIMEW